MPCPPQKLFSDKQVALAAEVSSLNESVCLSYMSQWHQRRMAKILRTMASTEPCHTYPCPHTNTQTHPCPLAHSIQLNCQLSGPAVIVFGQLNQRDGESSAELWC